MVSEQAREISKNDALQDAVRELARARQAAKAAKSCAHEVEGQLNASPLGLQLEKLQAEVNEAAEHEMELYDRVRALAVELFEKTGDKEPHQAAKIGLYTTLDYDPQRARDWSAAHMPDLLKLDKRAFEKVAKAAPMTFVEIKKEPRARISTDLSEWMD